MRPSPDPSPALALVWGSALVVDAAGSGFFSTYRQTLCQVVPIPSLFSSPAGHHGLNDPFAPWIVLVFLGKAGCAFISFVYDAAHTRQCHNEASLRLLRGHLHSPGASKAPCNDAQQFEGVPLPILRQKVRTQVSPGHTDPGRSETSAGRLLHPLHCPPK